MEPTSLINLVPELVVGSWRLYRSKLKPAPIIAFGELTLNNLSLRNKQLSFDANVDVYKKAMIDLIQPAKEILIWTCHGSPLREQINHQGRGYWRTKWRKLRRRDQLTEHDRAFARSNFKGDVRKCRIIVFRASSKAEDCERDEYLSARTGGALAERLKQFEESIAKSGGETWFTAEWVLKEQDVIDSRKRHLDIAYVKYSRDHGSTYLCVSDFTTGQDGADASHLWICRDLDKNRTAARLIYAVLHYNGKNGHSGVPIVWSTADEVPAQF